MKYLIISFLITNILAANIKKPNIIFMMADDQAWNGLSVKMHPDLPESKHPYIQTPNLEKLSQQGMRFSTAYAPSPVCSPTRISLQTGKSPAVLHWTKAANSVKASNNYPLIPPQNIKDIRSQETTISEILRSADYRTAHFGKWHIEGGGPAAHGYDEHDGNLGNEYASDFKDPNPADIFGMAKRASDFMRKSNSEALPFFIQMSFHALHAPQNALRLTIEKYKKISPNSKEKELYRAAISEDLDTAIGQVLATIDSLKISESTYVVYMSDNGAGGNKTILKGGKGDLWEGGIRSPMIVRGPSIAKNSWCHERVVGYDLFPTFCHWAGIKSLPQGLEGGNLNELLLNQGVGTVKRSRNFLTFHFPHYQGDSPHSAIYFQKYKLIKFYETGKSVLYNIQEDISESHDLSSGLPEISIKLESLLSQYLDEIDAQFPTVNKDYDPSKESIVHKGKNKINAKKNRPSK